jgi:aspartate racemase
MARMIGIVGGVGTFAGIDLYRKIYQHTDARSDQEHPPVALLSIPARVSDRTRFLEGEIEENPGIAIAGIIKTLAHIGSEVIGIPCNTAHAPVIFQEILKRIPKSVKLLHLIEEVGTYISSGYPGIRKVGVLATMGTCRSNIYTDVLASHDIEVLYPEESMQKSMVHPAIHDRDYGIKASADPVTEKARHDLLEAAMYLVRQGSEAIVLGCTEIQLAIQESRIGQTHVIDSVSVLARALVQKSIYDIQ